MHLHLQQEAWGHVVATLPEHLPTRPAASLIEQARVLDNFYVPTRYPNGHSEGPPFQHYGPLQSEQAITHARAIVAFAAAQMD